jgi:hypothetical protein
MAVGNDVRRAYAGPSDPAYWPETEFATQRVPRRKLRTDDDARLIELYRRALALWRRPRGPEASRGFEEIHDVLRNQLPRDWLLRWNVLECLRKLGIENRLTEMLRSELLEIESQAPRDLPISTGLRYLDARYPRRLAHT